MTKQEETMQEAAKIEIESRELLLARLDYPRKLLVAAAEKRRIKLKEKLERLSAFTNENDAHEAYGYGMITWEEYEEIRDRFENNEALIDETTPEDYAVELLDDFIHRLFIEINTFRADLEEPKNDEERRREDI